MIELPALAVAAAFGFAAERTGYAVPETLPPAYLVPRAAVAPGRVGLGTGEAARGRAIYGVGIVLADDLSPVSVEAILAHEATHWLQEANGAERCVGLREWQAHVIHSAYLVARTGRVLDVDWARLRAAAEGCR